MEYSEERHSYRHQPLPEHDEHPEREEDALANKPNDTIADFVVEQLYCSAFCRGTFCANLIVLRRSCL